MMKCCQVTDHNTATGSCSLWRNYIGFTSFILKCPYMIKLFIQMLKFGETSIAVHFSY